MRSSASARVNSDSGFREDEVVVVGGAALAEFDGAPIDELALLTWDERAQVFVPVPFQIDERVDRVFNPGLPLEFRELVYDVLREEDGLLDPDDELAFVFRDAGPRAPTEVGWPESAEGARVEIAVESLAPGGGGDKRFAYLFRGESLPRSDVRYVTWDESAFSSIETTDFAVDYEGPWLLTGFRVSSPCGSGVDLLDRAKGRALPFPNNEEDEEGWDKNAVYLGGISGPVRAIRYVRGAQSGVNTIHHDIVTPRRFDRRINLRVHSLYAMRFYLDFRPRPGALLYLEGRDGRITVDGLPETLGSAFPAWSVYGSPDGGLGAVFDVPASERYSGPELFYRDDLEYDDTIASNPGYGDEDDEAQGAHGFRLWDTEDSNVDAHPMRFVLIPICEGAASPTLGQNLAELVEEPVIPEAQRQFPGLSAVRGLQIAKEAAGTRLSWEPVAGALAYRVYTSDDPARPTEQWERVAEISETTWLDERPFVSALLAYKVATVGEGGESIFSEK